MCADIERKLVTYVRSWTTQHNVKSLSLWKKIYSWSAVKMGSVLTFFIVKSMINICEVFSEQCLGVFIQQVGIMITYCKKVLYTSILYITQRNSVVS